MLFRVGAHTLGIDVDDDPARMVFNSTYALLQCRSEHRAPHCTASLRRLADGRLHARFGRHALPATAVTASDMRAAYVLAREMFARCASGQDGSIALYGALVGTLRGAVLLLGPAGIGKSVLALHLAQSGAEFLGDETALLSLKTGEISALPRRPALRESALGVLPEALRERVSRAPHVFQTERGRFWYALEETEIDVAPSDRRLPLRAVCVVNGRGDDFSMQPLTVREAVPAVLQRAYARRSELAEASAVRSALRGVACFNVVAADPETSAREILRGLDACA
jgi:hypothetical protein